jgi:hypothetical protein
MIAVHCAHTALVHPDKLRPNPANPNKHSAHQIQLLAAIIQQQGWRAPITVSRRSGLVVRGHGRLEAAQLIGCEGVPVDEQHYESEAAEMADLLADNRIAELAELDDDGLRAVIDRIKESDPDFDLDLTGFTESDLLKLFEEEPPDDEVETIPRMECQPFEHHDYLVFMFHDLRDWMLALQLIGVREVDYSITRTTKKIGIGRVLHGKRLLELARKALAGGVPGAASAVPALGHPEPQPLSLDHQPPALPHGDAPGS